jgi:hypothetical protein
MKFQKRRKWQPGAHEWQMSAQAQADFGIGVDNSALDGLRSSSTSAREIREYQASWLGIVVFCPLDQKR